MSTPVLHAIASKIANYLNVETIEFELPPSTDLGDLAFAVFAVAKKAGKSPQEITDALIPAIKQLPGITDAQTVKNGYINIRLEYQALFEPIRIAIADPAALLTKPAHGRVMVEYFSPNTNKPLHLGHARNIFLGESISNLLQAIGYEVVRSTLFNDRGIAMSNAQLGYELWGANTTPESTGTKGDHFVGNFYVLFSQKSKGDDENLEKQAQELLQRWEKGDPEIRDQWRKLRDWAIAGFHETLNRLGVKLPEVVFWESEYWDKAAVMVREGLERGVFKRNEKGAIIAHLGRRPSKKKWKETDWVVAMLREDGTTLYTTQDLYLASLKFEKYSPLEKSIYVVGAEQNEHFAALFEIFRRWGFIWANRCYHLGYRLVLFSGGKLKSREGAASALDIDAVMNKLESTALAEVEARNPNINGILIQQRSNLIARAALKWQLLKFNALKDINFDPVRSLSFIGDTGPYLLYSYVRVKSLMRKARVEKSAPPVVAPAEVTPEERRLAVELALFPQSVMAAANTLNPSLLCAHLLRLADLLNTYYERYRVLETPADIRLHRLALCTAVGQVLRWGLNLLGIEILEEM